MTELEKNLSQGFHALNLESLELGPFIAYLQLLAQWNQVYNLTAIRDLETMVTKHLFDSLAILPWLQGPNLLDLGSGAGLPGIPLALARPDLNFVLLDSNGKKARFLQEVKRQLRLKNVDVEQMRVEDYKPIQGFDSILSRAFSSLDKMISLSQHLLKPQGLWLAMKGKEVAMEVELSTLNLKYQTEIKRYSVPGISDERGLVLIRRL